MRSKWVCLIGLVCLVASATFAIAAGHDGYGTPDNARAMRWWNALNAEQMVAALYGDEATAEQMAAAQRMYADLDDDTKALVNAITDELLYGGVEMWWVSLLYGDEATAEQMATARRLYADLDDDTKALLNSGISGFDSVGEWWETLDCRLMRIAAGDGNMADPMSPYCAHYPGSGAAKILSDDATAHVDQVGMALLDLDEPGLFAPDNARAMRWWNALDAEQMVAALYGDEATAAQTAAAQKMYAYLDDDTKALVNVTADELYGMGYHDSVGDWWETLDCRLMRVAAGDGNTADPMSPYCAHYPGSGAAKILSDYAKAHVDDVGMALLNRDDPGLFVPYVGRGRHGIGTALEYVTTHEDGTTTQISFEYTGYGMYRGRDVLVVQDSQAGSASPTEYWDLETGNWMVSFDADGEVVEEQIPHTGIYAFPMMEGTRPQFVFTYCTGECPPDAGTHWHEFTVEACGIELEVPAGTFTVCRITATDASWLEGAGIGIEDVEFTYWYDPENDLEVKSHYADPWVDLGVRELSAYELVE